ncbi:MarR family transcriptional regulator [Spiractinospora alimapuensis]|uniref:MarR family transcriptional regulator n=1 Tax=Spiractinospora alimapuensis TaxID=2820884 RepID=UPI001F2DCD4D|nr:MarR family transcriptional regulator [Spiractinospora alimapuensis]QVQ52661.1 MarR family transcriptional regulator [Spiractinospora alimapuensis]
MSQQTVTSPVDPLVLRHVAAELDRRAERVVREFGLTVDQWRMLEMLSTRDAPTMSALATVLGLTGATTTRIADRLATQALAYRDADAGDRRRVVLRPSRRGLALYERLAAEVHTAQDDVLAPLDEAERRTLTRLLRRVASGPTSGVGETAGPEEAVS